MMKETEMKRVPKLRFPEFTDDWEQRKLDELSEFITKGATPTTYGFEWQTSGIPFFRNDAIKNNRFIYGDYSYISKEANEVLKRSEIHASDILIAITGDIGKVGIIPENIEKGNINQHIARVRVTKDAIPYFIYQSLCIERQQRKYQLIKTGLSMPQLSLEQIRETVVLCPSLSEQEKIGEYFCHIDHLITLHQRKLKNLNVLKKGVMQKLFSQKIRFKADDGSEFPEWEEKKLDDVAVRVTRKNKDNITDIPLTISSADGLIDQRDFFNKVVASKDMSGYYLLKKGEFAYNKSYSKGYDFGSIKKLDLYAEGALSTLYICFALNKDENPDFYQKYFDSLFWYLELQKICAEGARNHGLLNVSTNEFFQMKLKVPSSKQEQKKIADCLSSLDDVIEKQKVTLAAWEEMKKGLLQQMFV